MWSLMTYLCGVYRIRAIIVLVLIKRGNYENT